MKIGFVDYYISEWHANNYPRWIAQMCEQFGYDARIAYAWAELDCSPEDNVTTQQWCDDNGAQMCESIDELCEKSDAIVILAPSDPEKHLEYAKAVLKYKKPTYIDKTFSDSLENALAIYAEAEKNGASFFSTSALRYADELDGAKGALSLDVFGSGSSIDEYIIHQIEMAVTVMGVGFESVVCHKSGDNCTFTLKRSDERSATMTFGSGLRFGYKATLENGECVEQTARSSYFKTLMVKILEFFKTGELPFDKEQTVEAMRIRDGVLKALELEGTEIML